ncbi:MAG: polysulfide reductase NrfD, partial [Thermoanaerobaculales bacterium]|nr:polysulfide reductase NrfD [Thermoanaerobaculales bacterium]
MTDVTVDAGPPNSGIAGYLTPFNIITGVILAGGAVILGIRFTQGLSATTNLSHTYPWGLWIGFDVMSGVALAAGGFVTSTAVYIFGMKEYKPVVRSAILTGFLGYFLVVLGLLADLGRPWRLPYPFIKSAGPTSPLFEVALCVALYLTVLFIETTPAALEWLGLKRWRKVVGSMTIGLTILGLILSTMHQSTLGAMYMATPTRLHALWYSSHIPVHFFVSAVAAGLAMVIVEG